MVSQCTDAMELFLRQRGGIVKNIFKRTIFTKSFIKRPFMTMFYFAVNMFYRKQIKMGIVPNII